MNIRNINSTSEASQLLANHNRDASDAGCMVIESTDISPLAVMARLRRLRRSNPIRFKVVMASISSALFSGNATCSRATKSVVVASEPDKTFLMAPQTRRWPIAIFAGVALVGFAMLMLLRAGHHAAERLATNIAHGSTPIVRTTGLGREGALKDTEPRAPVANSGKTNADSPALPPVAGTRPVAKPLLLAAASRPTEAGKRNQQGARRTTPLPTTKEWSSDERWLAH